MRNACSVCGFLRLQRRSLDLRSTAPEGKSPAGHTAAHGTASVQDGSVPPSPFVDGLLSIAQPLTQSCLQVCGVCDTESASRWQREAWRLVEEQMLLEARITLLKLASRLDAMYAEVSTSRACLRAGRLLC